MSDDETTYSSIKTVLGGTRRDQRWHLTDAVDVLTFLGSSRFDLRTVETAGNQVVEINITCVLGVVDLLVPAGTIVVLDGASFLANARSSVSDGADSLLPRLEVTATTVLGRVRVRSPRSDENLEESADPVAAVADIATARGEPDELVVARGANLAEGARSDEIARVDEAAADEHEETTRAAGASADGVGAVEEPAEEPAEGNDPAAIEDTDVADVAS